MYIDGYHDHLILRLRSRVEVHRAPKGYAIKIHDDARKYYEKVDGLLDDRCTDQWFDGFERQALTFLPAKVAKKATSAQACRRCEQLAWTARDVLETEDASLRPFASFLLFIGLGLPCIGVEDALLADLGGDGAVSPVTAGRTLQLVGVQACRRRGRRVEECHCARSIVRDEGQGQLDRLLTHGASDWNALADIGLATLGGFEAVISCRCRRWAGALSNAVLSRPRSATWLAVW